MTLTHYLTNIFLDNQFLKSIIFTCVWSCLYSDHQENRCRWQVWVWNSYFPNKINVDDKILIYPFVIFKITSSHLFRQNLLIIAFLKSIHIAIHRLLLQKTSFTFTWKLNKIIKIFSFNLLVIICWRLLECRNC